MDKARWKEEEACDVCVWKWNSWSEHIFDVGVKKRGGRSFTATPRVWLNLIWKLVL
jgi:hypothetical protein